MIIKKVLKGENKQQRRYQNREFIVKPRPQTLSPKTPKAQFLSPKISKTLRLWTVTRACQLLLYIMFWQQYPVTDAIFNPLKFLGSVDSEYFSY